MVSEVQEDDGTILEQHDLNAKGRPGEMGLSVSSPLVALGRRLPLGVDLGSEKSVDLVSLELPDRERRCQMVEADEPELAGAALAAKLVEDKKLTGFVH